jgi:hypothetical protein
MVYRVALHPDKRMVRVCSLGDRQLPIPCLFLARGLGAVAAWVQVSDCYT